MLDLSLRRFETVANEGLGRDSLLKMLNVILVVTIASWLGGRSNMNAWLSFASNPANRMLARHHQDDIIFLGSGIPT